MASSMTDPSFIRRLPRFGGRIQPMGGPILTAGHTTIDSQTENAVQMVLNVLWASIRWQARASTAVGRVALMTNTVMPILPSF
jgi:hypothetical protein